MAETIILSKFLCNFLSLHFYICSILASLNLPASIEDLTGNTVPPSVLEKAQQLKDKGGLSAIDNMMQNLPDLLQRNQEVMDEVRQTFFPDISIFH